MPKPTPKMVNAACRKIDELDDKQTHWWDVVEAALQAALDEMEKPRPVNYKPYHTRESQ